ncbi:hypothetical protein [Trueperella pyogenes]|uniref:hypothetical protein n=1 Tax=Trueperella pyogenes TaxID=1661 RepID=UPI00043ABE4B|nr:hypothetical protein [Trueperella pyogenes]AHU90386.1 hypothetical protein CQ11_01360 [Trueperella pyogenes]AWA42773.1 hypothetical protein DBV13_01355 [Trueperella pyogenes]
MNNLTADRKALIAALELTGLAVDETQPELLDRGTILLDAVRYEWGDTFTAVKATHTAHVILDAFDAASARLEQEKAAQEIWIALRDTGAADVESAGELFNMADAHGNLFPAFTITLISHINFS